MADDMALFQNNCESNDRNGVASGKSEENVDEAASGAAHINKTTGDGVIAAQAPTQDAVDAFLAGKDDCDFAEADEDGPELEEGICFDVGENGERHEEEDDKEDAEEEEKEKRFSARGGRFMVKSLKKRSIKCLNKMQIMEDVREGCNDQPSSPGHAEQRSDQEKVQENGYEEMQADKENEEKSENQDDQQKEEPESDMVEESKPELPTEETFNDNASSNNETNKRKSENLETPIKRLRSEIHDNFVSRDKILTEFIEMADCANIDQIHMFSEQLLAEVKTLNELAKEKEREWNNIIHLKKLKEELLLRMQRKKQILMLNDKSDYGEPTSESQCENGEDRLKPGSPQSILKANLTCPQKNTLRIPSVSLNGDRSQNRLLLSKAEFANAVLNGSVDYRMGKQRPTLDVQSIIADYRQQHPETVPRRGRRIRAPQGSAGKMNILNYSSMALGSGSQVRQNSQDVSNELGMLLNTINGNRQDALKPPSSDSNNQKNDSVSFKDMLLQFAKLSQSERNELIQNAIKPPPPYPEVTVHPVPTTTAPPTNSLLHGILTKNPNNKQNSKTSFSPTLARLLTAPERATAGNNQTISSLGVMSNTTHPSNVSISEILSTSKARNEITITPVETQMDSPPTKGRAMVEEETEDSADRLVIDESNEEGRRSSVVIGDNSSDGGDEVPQCQGCNQRAAQFVCAGCGNQWYCSRDCQVSAWDEHSEVCSG